MANAWRSLRHPVGLVPSLARFKVVVDSLRADLQIRQLRGIEAAYAGPAGPDVLVFGDSAMLWRSATEPEKRSLAAMLADEFGGDVSLHFVLGNAYNPRLVRAFVTALSRTASKPKAVIVPTSLMTTAQAWLAHPDLGYETASTALLDMIGSGTRRPRRLPRAPHSAWESYDRQPAPSLIGERRTLGELRMIVNAVPANPRQRPTSKWQHLVRTRYLSDLTNAERLRPESPGVRCVAELAETLRALDIPSLAYISPVNYELINKLLRKDVVAHLAANEQTVADAYRGAGESAEIVTGALISEATDFGDAVHLNGAGRRRFAPLLAEPVRKFLVDPREP